MKAISLCSGADGFSLAASLLGIEVVAHVEIDPVFDEHYKTHFPNAKRYYDLKTVNPEEMPAADIIYGGEPCQGNSVAGNRKGKEADTYLWPDYFRICKAKRPRWIINENVTGSISNMVLDTKIADLESIGYTCQAYNIPAVSVGAYHERQRIWLVAYTNSIRRTSGKDICRSKKGKLFRQVQEKNFGRNSLLCQPSRGATGRIWPMPVSGIHPMANDVPTELAEIKAYGNAVNPWIPYVLLSFIQQIESQY